MKERGSSNGAEEIGFHRSLALDLDGIAFLKLKTITEQFIRSRCQLGPAGYTMRFHAARRVHRVTPKVVNELSGLSPLLHKVHIGGGCDLSIGDGSARRLASYDSLIGSRGGGNRCFE